MATETDVVAVPEEFVFTSSRNPTLHEINQIQAREEEKLRQASAATHLLVQNAVAAVFKNGTAQPLPLAEVAAAVAGAADEAVVADEEASLDAEADAVIDDPNTPDVDEAVVAKAARAAAKKK